MAELEGPPQWCCALVGDLIRASLPSLLLVLLQPTAFVGALSSVLSHLGDHLPPLVVLALVVALVMHSLPVVTFELIVLR